MARAIGPEKEGTRGEVLRRRETILQVRKGERRGEGGGGGCGREGEEGYE